MTNREQIVSSHERLMSAILQESQRFQEYYLWLEKFMPSAFFEELDTESIAVVRGRANHRWASQQPHPLGNNTTDPTCARISYISAVSA